MLKLIIAKCPNREVAEKVAKIVCAASSVDLTKLRDALTSNSIGIKMQGASQTQVDGLRDKIQLLGVGVSVQEVIEDVMEAVATPPQAPAPPAPSKVEIPKPKAEKPKAEAPKPKPAPVVRSAKATDEDCDDDEDVASDFQNLVRVVDSRPDLFKIETERPLLTTVLVCLIVGISSGFWFNGMDFLSTSPDFFERLPSERTAKLVVDLPKIETKDKKEDKKKRTKDKELDRKKEKPKPKGSGMAQAGQGDPRAKITHKGVLGIISGKVKSKTVVGSNLLQTGSFAKDIDAVLQSIGGLKTSGETGSGRKGMAGIGFGKGYGAGYGTGGIDDMIGGMFGGSESVGLKKKGEMKVQAPRSISGVGPMAGGRSQESIMRVVMQHLAGLRYAYNKRLKEKPGLKGKIIVRFSIDPPGNVVDAKVIGSTMDDPMLENEIASQVQRWQFDPVDKPGLAVVEYPFAFSQ